MMRKPKQADKGKLRNMEGKVVAHDENAETLAQYCSKI